MIELADLGDVRDALTALVNSFDTGLLTVKGRRQRGVVHRVRGAVTALDVRINVSAPARRGAEPEAAIRTPISMSDLLDALKSGQKAGRNPILHQLGLDTPPKAEALVADILQAAHRAEHELNVRRSKESHMATKADKGSFGAGTTAPPELQARIRQMLAERKSYRQIARQLDVDGVPTLRGGEKWPATTVGKIIRAMPPEPLANPEAIAPWYSLDLGFDSSELFDDVYPVTPEVLMPS